MVETQDTVGYWACLSHCWGVGKKPLETTRDTLSQHLIAIPLADLPKTFREAVIFTRRFDIQYLWVDSLCIIQGDFDDWNSQAAQMADIYRNSILTIAASASSGPHEGLFRQADQAHIDEPLTSTMTHTNLNNIRCRKRLSHDAAELPLLQRCWVHQERLLSPRYLHFSHHEVIWECMELLACECGGIKHGYRALTPSWPAPKDHRHSGALQLDDWMTRRGPSAWHAVVADYSRMNLKNSADIFPAISGLAKGVREATRRTYVAGLWKENLIVDLVWMTVNPQSAERYDE